MKVPNEFISIDSEFLSFHFIPTGDVFEMNAGSFLINQFRGNAKDGSCNNIYLRIYENNQIKQIYPLLGQASKSQISFNKNVLRFEGCANEISYQVDFFLVENSWFYEVTLNSSKTVTVDLLYGQDIGLSGKENVLTNELYISQYLGHEIFKGDNGYVICSRQNMPDQDCNPYLQQGLLKHHALHYCTDGIDFFGLDYKQSNEPYALYHGLTDRKNQYEFAYAGLLSETFEFTGEDTCVFYGHFIKHHPDSVKDLAYTDEIHAQYQNKPAQDSNFIPARTFTKKTDFTVPYHSMPIDEKTLDLLFPVKRLKEEKDGQLYSFFTKDHTHVVTKEKELHVARPHGTIVMTPPSMEEISDQLISSTHYMYGIFNSHIVLGNTNMHKFISTPRGFLNIQKNSGQRIYIKIDQQYRLLGLPALYEMGMNFSRWYYNLGFDMITVCAYATNVKRNTSNSEVQTDVAQIHLEVHSAQNRTYDFIVTDQISLGVNEYTSDIQAEVTSNGLHFPFENDLYEHLSYDIFSDEPCIISDDRIFYEEARPFDETFVTMQFLQQSKLHLTMYGTYEKDKEFTKALDFAKEAKLAQDSYASIMKHFSIESEDKNEQLQILDETAWWYTHNAMIHFCMPHGLEQPGGAAWGTRDICQGPMEYFLATNHVEMVRLILLNIFSHQEDATKEWPQWFMFDKYNMNAGECHGDVVFWPLKSIADYLIQTNDYAILKEVLPYADVKDKTETLFSHIKAAIQLVKDTRFIEDTGLITYAGGDWDDTLQPAKAEMKEKLVSVWTQALAYQTFTLLKKAFETYDKDFSNQMDAFATTTKNAFLTYGIKDDVIAGFLEWDGSLEYLLHPLDTQTGIHYRLLPQTRSIIAELVDQKQATKNISVIHEKLACPDGVRLMDAPASYDGGVSHLFKRAEQAANIGREISLQYTHAHIRYIEAMAKYGNHQFAWDGLFKINPILIEKSVSNAMPRQSNLYFSSSEGDYLDRYQYQREFDRLRTGDIAVKGGWRLYSSGPGIYMHQLISHIIGIRFKEDSIIFDPILPDSLADFTVSLECFGVLCTFDFQKSKDSILRICANDQVLSFTDLQGTYRMEGIQIRRNDFLSIDNHHYQIQYS